MTIRQSKIKLLNKLDIQEIERKKSWKSAANMHESYLQAVDDALTCWEMTTTGNAKYDLNNLICMELQVALDPNVSLDARTLIHLGKIEAAKEIMKIIANQKLHHDSEFLLLSAIKDKFELDI